MGRRRTFDEDEVVRAAVGLFGARAYDGVSVDDLVTHLGVHRNSLYKVFGSKRGLYLAALRWHLEHEVRPLLATSALGDILAGDGASGLDLLLLALVERAPVDAEVAREVADAMRDFDAAVEHALDADGAPPALAHALTATLLGLHLRARAGVGIAGAGAALFDRLHRSPS